MATTGYGFTPNFGVNIQDDTHPGLVGVLVTLEDGMLPVAINLLQSSSDHHYSLLTVCTSTIHKLSNTLECHDPQ